MFQKKIRFLRAKVIHYSRSLAWPSVPHTPSQVTNQPSGNTLPSLKYSPREAHIIRYGTVYPAQKRINDHAPSRMPTRPAVSRFTRLFTSTFINLTIIILAHRCGFYIKPTHLGAWGMFPKRTSLIPLKLRLRKEKKEARSSSQNAHLGNQKTTTQMRGQ